MRPQQRVKGFQTVPKLGELAGLRYQIRSFLSFSETASEACGVPAQQYQLLQVIGSGREGESVSINNVAERMLLRHNSAVELVDRAQRAGLVERCVDALDHRRALVELTKRGQSVLERLAGEHLTYLEAHGPALVRALEQVTGIKTMGKEAGESR